MNLAARWNQKFPTYIILVILFFIGLSLRLTKIESKPFWRDETYSATLSNGRTTEEIQEQLVFQGHLKTSQLRGIQDEKQGQVTSVLRALKQDEPHYLPGFHLFSHWIQIHSQFGFYSDRYVAAFFSAWIIPGLFLITWELTHLLIPSLIAAFLGTLSPVSIIYGQEARNHVLMMPISVFLGYFFLKAIQTKKQRWWLGYLVVTITSFYTHLLSFLIILGHFVFLIVYPLHSKKETFRSFLLTLGVGLLAFSPWIQTMWIHGSFGKQIQSHSADFNIPFQILVSVGSLTYTFLDLDLKIDRILTTDPILSVVPILFIILFFLYNFLKLADRKAKLYLLTQLVIYYLSFFVFFLAGAKSVFLLFRYFLPIPCFLIIIVSISIGKLVGRPARKWTLPLTSILIFLLFSASIQSLSLYYQSGNWWNKCTELHNEMIANELREAKGSFVMSDSYLNLFGLAGLLNDSDEVKFRIITNPKGFQLGSELRDHTLFLISTEHSFNEAVIQNLQFTHRVRKRDSVSCTEVYELKPI